VGPQSADALPIEFASGVGAQVVTLDLSKAGISLEPGHTYFFRALAAGRIASEDTVEWEPPAVIGATGSFTTPEPPAIFGESVADVTQRDATLNALINGQGLETKYEFQIAKAPACLPVPAPFMPCARVETGDLAQATVPASFEVQSVSLDLNSAGMSLEAGATYSFRVVASNAGGSSEGAGKVFTAAAALAPPQACPLSTLAACPGSPLNPPPVRCRKGEAKSHVTCVKKPRCHHHRGKGHRKPFPHARHCKR
jgi:hypothetical protein